MEKTLVPCAKKGEKLVIDKGKTVQGQKIKRNPERGLAKRRKSWDFGLASITTGSFTRTHASSPAAFYDTGRDSPFILDTHIPLSLCTLRPIKYIPYYEVVSRDDHNTLLRAQPDA